MEIRGNTAKNITAVAHPSCSLGTRVTQILFLDPSKTTVQLLNSPPTRRGSWYYSGALSQCCENSILLLVKENFETPPRVFPLRKRHSTDTKAAQLSVIIISELGTKCCQHFQATTNKPPPSGFHLLSTQLSPSLLHHCLCVDKL